tara:strand:+ start:246 stop:491 length:246 start_codon:yes stop_codon:yes gene_type:complete
MSDKIMSEEELEIQVQEDDRIKEQSIHKHKKEIDIMNRAIFAINEYIIHFGRTSNVHDQCFDLKLQIEENKKHLENWISKI